MRTDRRATDQIQNSTRPTVHVEDFKQRLKTPVDVLDDGIHEKHAYFSSLSVLNPWLKNCF